MIDASSAPIAHAHAMGAPAWTRIASNGRIPVDNVWCATADRTITPRTMASGATLRNLGQRLREFFARLWDALKGDVDGKQGGWWLLRILFFGVALVGFVERLLERLLGLFERFAHLFGFTHHGLEAYRFRAIRLEQALHHDVGFAVRSAPQVGVSAQWHLLPRLQEVRFGKPPGSTVGMGP